MIEQASDSGTAGAIPDPAVTLDPALAERPPLLDRPLVRVLLAVLGGLLVLAVLGLVFSPRYWRF